MIALLSDNAWESVSCAIVVIVFLVIVNSEEIVKIIRAIRGK